MKRVTTADSQILLFPVRVDADQGTTPVSLPPDPKPIGGAAVRSLVTVDIRDIVICGSFRKDTTQLKRDFEELRDLGFNILSPTNATVVSEKDGFVFMDGEETSSPEKIELRHLEAIRHCAFVWLHAPDGYLGLSAALEIGFARANGIPVYGRTFLQEKSLQGLVVVVGSPDEVVAIHRRHPVPPLPAVQAFQKYYATAAMRRGYEKETAQDTLLLMLEEFGELARAVRKRHKLRRDSKGEVSNEEHELADIFIYVIHMANVLGVDLAAAVQSKEQLNIQRFLAR